MRPPFSRVFAFFAVALLVAPKGRAEDAPDAAAAPPLRPTPPFEPFPTTRTIPGVAPHPITEADVWRDVGRGMERITRAFAWLELAFPDVRLQTPARVGDGVDALVVSWPVHVVGFMTRHGQQGAGGSLFVEPAFPTTHAAVRGLGGVRVWAADRSTGLAVVLEGGGLVATDGHGAFAGGGPAIGDLGALFALVARRSFVSGADRWDFTLELSMPAYTLVELVGG